MIRYSLVIILLIFSSSNGVQAQIGNSDSFGNPKQLNAPLVENGDVSSNYQTSSDNQWVVYIADQDTDGHNALYSVPIAGGAAIKLNSGMSGSVQSDFKISLDSQSVVFLYSRDLYSVPIDGGTPIKLNGVNLHGSSTSDFKITPDSQRVVYLADQEVRSGDELYSVPIDGSATAVRLDYNSNDLWNVEDFKISPDSKHVLYLPYRSFSSEIQRLYIAPILGDKPPIALTAEGGSPFGFVNSQRVYYYSDQENEGDRELFTASLTGDSIVKVNSDLVSGGDVASFQIISDKERVVYRADQIVDGVYELFSVPITGGTSVKLNLDLAIDEDIGDYKITPDNQYVVYTIFKSGIGDYELLSVPISGGTPIRLNSDLVSKGKIPSFQISQDSQYVVYRADQNEWLIYELFSVPIRGGNVIALNNLIDQTGEEIWRDYWQISLDSQRVVYIADQIKNERFELFSVPIAGGETSIINRPLAVLGDVEDFVLSQDSQFIIYRADQDIGDELKLFSVEVFPFGKNRLDAYPFINLLLL